MSVRDMSNPSFKNKPSRSGIVQPRSEDTGMIQISWLGGNKCTVKKTQNNGTSVTVNVSQFVRHARDQSSFLC